MRRIESDVPNRRENNGKKQNQRVGGETGKKRARVCDEKINQESKFELKKSS